MRTCTLLLATVGVMIYATSTPATGCGVSFGKQVAAEDGWEPIIDIKDQHIQELGGWAVSEFLKHANCRLKFNKVVSGKLQILTGMNFELIINASDILSGKADNYKAEVYEQERTKTRKLISFNKGK